MGHSNRKAHFDKKNSARARGRQQGHVEFDCEGMLKTLQQEKRDKNFKLVSDISQPNDKE